MRTLAAFSVIGFALAALGADVESRRLTHYVPQDLLESAIRKEGWTEIPLNLKGGILKGDIVRIWTGGSIDRGNGDQPGKNVNGPTGIETSSNAKEAAAFALSPIADHAYALLFKCDSPGLKKPLPPGRPLEIKMTKDNEKLSVGFNDLRGQYNDNHLGRGRRHEFDPLWIRIEVVRTIVD
jgi:hypothetical protein